MIINDVAAAYLEATPMVAVLRQAGTVRTVEIPVRWELTGSTARFTAVWSSDEYLRFDEACVLAGDEVVVSHREREQLALPPGAIYEAQFTFQIDEA